MSITMGSLLNIHIKPKMGKEKVKTLHPAQGPSKGVWVIIDGKRVFIRRKKKKDNAK